MYAQNGGIKTKQKIYQWRVSHPKHGAVLVVGGDKLKAVQTAARLWRVPWTTIARDCTYDKGPEVEAAV